MSSMMMKFLDWGNVPLGRWLGVKVRLHWTWILALIGVLIYDYRWASIYVGVFALVLLHELGHCMAGVWRKAHVVDVILLPIGGAARMAFPTKPVDELIITAAGPLVNLLLWIPLAWIVGHVWPPAPLTLADVGGNFWAWMHFYNLILLFFNLIPAFPLDGGRVFRAAMGFFISFERATYIAARIGQVFGGLLTLLGLLHYDPWCIAIGLYLIFAGESELKYCRLRFALNRCHQAISTAQKEGLGPKDALAESAKILAEVERSLWPHDRS